jgi:hypothetical protein
VKTYGAKYQKTDIPIQRTLQEISIEFYGTIRRGGGRRANPEA